MFKITAATQRTFTYMYDNLLVDTGAINLPLLLRVRNYDISHYLANLRFNLLSFLVLGLQSSQPLVIKPRISERHQKQFKYAEELVRFNALWFLAEQFQRLLTLNTI